MRCPIRELDLFSNVTTMQEKAISKLCGQLHVLYNTGSQSHERLIYSMRRTQFYIGPTSLQHIDTFGQTVELRNYGFKSPTSF